MGKKIRQERATAAFPLAFHEKLLLWRRRKNWGQVKAAAHFDVAVFVYKQTEYGRMHGFKPPRINLGPLRKHEKCFIYRKRSGKTQKEIARQVGCSVYWLRLQELGKVPAPMLIAYWNTKTKK